MDRDLILSFNASGERGANRPDIPRLSFSGIFRKKHCEVFVMIYR